MRDDLREAVIDAARDYLLGCGGTGRLRHALIAYETAALDEAGMPMLAAGMVRADGLPPLTEMQQEEPFHECLSDAVNGGLSVMRIAQSDAVPTPVAAQASEPVAWVRTDELKQLPFMLHARKEQPAGSGGWVPLYEAPQPSAAAVRDAARMEALEEAANTATGFLVGDPLAGIPLRNPMTHEIAAAIRALKSAPPQPAEQSSASPFALFESGYALTDEEITKLAESMPGGLEGFLKGWGWQNFARAVESEVMLAIARAQGEQA